MSVTPKKDFVQETKPSPTLAELLSVLLDHKGSDLHVQSGEVPRGRINGELGRFEMPPLTESDVLRLAREVLDSDEKMREFQASKDCDAAIAIPNLGRFRVNLFYQRNRPGLVLRTIGTRIPTIEEILQLCRGQIGVYLDLKEDLVTELLPIIKKYDMERDIIWYIPASRMEVIKKLKDLSYKCLPMPDPGPEKNIQDVVNQVYPRVIASDMGQLTESFVKSAHANHAKVFVDEKKRTPEEWEQIIGWGTDGIQTDNPQALLEYL